MKAFSIVGLLFAFSATAPTFAMSRETVEAAQATDVAMLGEDCTISVHTSGKHATRFGDRIVERLQNELGYTVVTANSGEEFRLDVEFGDEQGDFGPGDKLLTKLFSGQHFWGIQFSNVDRDGNAQVTYRKGSEEPVLRGYARRQLRRALRDVPACVRK